MAELNHRDVENYLKTNPGFLKDWLCKHVPPETCQEWYTKNQKEEKRKRGKTNTSIASFPSSTDMFKNFVAGKSKKKGNNRLSVQELRGMNETDMFMELIRDIADELDINTLCHKILLNVSVLTKSDRGSLFLASGPKDKRVLVSKLFDVTVNSTVEDSLHSEEEEIKVPFGTGIAGHVALTKETVNIKDAYLDPRFNMSIDEKTGFKTHSILCMPILNREGEVIGVAEIINKTSCNHEFTEQDEEVFRKYLIFCGIGIQNAQLFEMSVLEYRRNQMLLSLARSIFEEQTNMEVLITKIMTQAHQHELIKCERCSVYILEFNTLQDYSFSTDPENEVPPSPASITTIENEDEIAFSMVFELNLENNNQVKKLEQDALTNSIHAKIAKRVAANKQTSNIPDVENDADFDFTKEADNGFKTRNMLCMPICNSKNEVVGVAQLINKPNRQGFTENDINIFETFAIFCGLGIHNTQMYENACKLMAKRKIALEVLSYHASASIEETDKLKEDEIPECDYFNLHSFDFNDFPLSEHQTVQATIRMFMDFDLINKFHIPYEVICRWSLSVKKNYRQVIYHNWRHAFNVAQTMFTMLKTGGLVSYINDLEILALLVACLCHDLDHRGTNNTFQIKSESPLARLYSTSVMEHHHFDHCIMILNSEGNNIFQALSPEQYQEAIRMLEHAILSTDLALYFKKRGQFENLVKEGEMEWVDPNSKDLLKSMMMTACDVAAITKPWEVQKEVAELVASEFFEQGDLTKLYRKSSSKYSSNSSSLDLSSDNLTGLLQISSSEFSFS
uniref:Phosphodiesterase n=1 Tax=Euperipatoides kanangrensis TaxID=488523 RepID=A0A0F7VKH5_9BILA|nr:Eka-cGMP gated channel beta 1 protein [Euperipatoides kanangrensis]CFW94237.1 Eka-PDE alpha protein [Euperipatoides kanangrensis]